MTVWLDTFTLLGKNPMYYFRQYHWLIKFLCNIINSQRTPTPCYLNFPMAYILSCMNNTTYFYYCYQSYSVTRNIFYPNFHVLGRVDHYFIDMWKMSVWATSPMHILHTWPYSFLHRFLRNSKIYFWIDLHIIFHIVYIYCFEDSYKKYLCFYTICFFLVYRDL